MSKLEQQFLEDRALRNSALAMFKADIEHAKTGLSGKGIAERTVSRIAAGAKDALDSTTEKAGDNVGVLAALVGAIALWFAREPILEALANELESDGDNQPETDEDGSPEIVLTPPDEDAIELKFPGDT